MTQWLIRKFVKNSEETHRLDVRFSYSLLSGIVGIICNIILFAVKLVTGIAAGSAAVLSDAVNNLTDCISCILSLIGNKIASRPADNEHPFGHGRMEYVVSLAAAALIFSAAYELFLNGIRKIIHPSGLSFTPVMGFVLAATIAVKFWMSRFNRTLGDKLDHPGMKAAAADSMNDVLATAMTLVSSVLAMLVPSIPFDGIMGALVAVYIFHGGYQLMHEIIGKLLGDEPDDELRRKIEKILLQEPGVLGVHDLVIHDYGAGNRMGTVHAEVDGDLSLRQAHEVIDACEYRVERELHVRLTIHPDPAAVDSLTMERKKKTQELLDAIVPGAAVHDFQVSQHEDNLVFRFDAALPFDCDLNRDGIRRLLEERLQAAGISAHCEITFEQGYFSERSQ